ncbi:MAG: bifunctional folylpolyglutamate synthase/dihydrofolate synthase [Ignavibacteriales bacterium]|nr:bifunctional folylpolyglutamate synthase/dihydrofolate synthase [Ignavibacteriales bacterium]
MKTYSESIQFLYGLQKFGVKLGLHGINALLHALGNPHYRFPCIHVAGTNGKGSTASMLAAVFTAAGYRTGLYTSPHLVDYRERIRIDGQPISPGDVVRLSATLKKHIEKNTATFFEATTAIAFQYFADSQVDMAIVETGLGGRLDATNVVQPVTTVITSVGLEHADILGKTLARIAREKAGIIKKGVPCISGVDSRNAERVLRETCRRQKAPFLSHHLIQTKVRHSSLNGLKIDVRTPYGEINDLQVSLPGEMQVKNVAAALLALQQTGSRFPLGLSEEHLRRGLSHIQEFSGIQGRLALVRKKPRVLADTAHNPQATAALAKSLSALGIKKVDLVFGVARDKDHVSMVRLLSKFTRWAIVVTAKTDRALDGTKLQREFQRNRVAVEYAGAVDRGVRLAMKRSRNGIPILITGSNFVVGEALAFMQGRKYLTINQ